MAIVKIFRIIRSEGFIGLIKRLKKKLKNKILNKVYLKKYKEELFEIIEQHRNKPIIIFPELLDWNIPLYQRPQHLAIELGKQGFLYFFCTPNHHYDSVQGFVQVGESTYITNQQELLFETIKERKIIHIYATDIRPLSPQVKTAYENGDIILYEYVDEIHEDIQGKVSEEVWNKHQNLLEDEKVVVVATADKLYKEVSERRSTNYALVTNGVEYEHFQQRFSYEEAPEEIKDLIRKKKPIIGYFGALAKWFDYELIEKLALSRPNYEILLIGWNYDNSIKQTRVESLENVTVIGPIDYPLLPKYASWFDVSTIPFLINDVTESTSPIKLFEYMALGKPIVTTNLPECRKYESVLIGMNHEDFIKQVDKALTLREDEEYKKVLMREGKENTWTAKAAQIKKLLELNLKQSSSSNI
jgi:teichuronic acid biosynthesis glycosyltransferase TuaH